MPTQEEVKAVLDTVLVPGVMRSLVKMNLVRDVSVANGKVDVTIATAALMKGAQDWIKDKVK
ncbi:MAG: iron-sulfur cluster assembly protein, partial [Chloroflexi bacterium]|nr:iron-sulfur cluster assembly protein [Chloroflexota bacterium]